MLLVRIQPGALKYERAVSSAAERCPAKADLIVPAAARGLRVSARPGTGLAGEAPTPRRAGVLRAVDAVPAAAQERRGPLEWPARRLGLSEPGQEDGVP